MSKFLTRRKGVFFPDLLSAVRIAVPWLRKVCSRTLLLLASLLFVSPADFAAEPRVLVLNDVN